MKSHLSQNWHWKYIFVPEVWDHVMNKMTLQELILTKVIINGVTLTTAC